MAITPQGRTLAPPVCFPKGPAGRRGLTRYEFAVAVARTFSNIDNDTVFYQHMNGNPYVLAALERLVVQFQPELSHMGVKEQEIQSWLLKIESLSPPKPQPLKAEPFADVPRGHWAFAAVERLREDGIVAGYDDGAYQHSTM
jgi:hypothetical protein